MIEALLTVLVVANVLPILPVVLQFTEGLQPRARRIHLLKAIAVGNLVALAVALGGSVLLDATRLTVPDLRIAGGIILLIFAVFDLLFSREQRKRPLGDVMTGEPDTQLVPMAVPLLVGPAVLTTVMVVAETYGHLVAAVAVVINAAINAAILLSVERLYGRMGGGIGRAAGKVMSLILATMAVSMIRTGVLEVWRGVTGP